MRSRRTINFLTFSITLSIKNGISQIEECICDCFESVVGLSSISLCDMVAGVAPSAQLHHNFCCVNTG